MAGPFYIHYPDPGFPDEPWPGERRLGPFDTAEEATEQAVNDAAGGYGLASGVYEEPESLKKAPGNGRGKATVTKADIKRRGETEAKRRLQTRQDTLDQDVQTLAALLPDGMGMDEARELLHGNQQAITETLLRARQEEAERLTQEAAERVEREAADGAA